MATEDRHFALDRTRDRADILVNGIQSLCGAAGERGMPGRQDRRYRFKEESPSVVDPAAGRRGCSSLRFGRGRCFQSLAGREPNWEPAYSVDIPGVGEAHDSSVDSVIRQPS